MVNQPPLYGFDLVTDTNESFIDPETHNIVKVGLSTSNGEEVYAGEEAEILQLVDHRLAVLPPGVLVTWQGSLLDFPLFIMRSQHHGMTPGLRLRADRRSAPNSVVRTVDHPWCADWHGHRHLELRRVYDAANKWWNPLRNRIDPESLNPPPDDLANRDPRKDARLARNLAERRWPQARKSIDRMPETSSWRSVVSPSRLDDTDPGQQQTGT